MRLWASAVTSADSEQHAELLRYKQRVVAAFFAHVGILDTNAPLWTRHDRAGRPGAPLTSHAFAKNLKRYANEAGVAGAHIHQTRHSFARIVAEDTGSITDVQDALGHRNAATTRVYVQHIAVKRDKHSTSVINRLNVKS